MYLQLRSKTIEEPSVKMSLIERLIELGVVPNFICEGIFQEEGDRQYTPLEIYPWQDDIVLHVKYLDEGFPRGNKSIREVIKDKYLGKYEPLRMVK